MRLLFFLLLASFSLSLSAQFGVMGSYNFSDHYNRPDGVSEEFNPFDLEGGPEIALNYWFRLAKKRVEFLPTLYYASTSTRDDIGKLNEYGFQFKVNIYPFDFGTDCNCPTFGKQGPNLQKGLFIQLSPGYALYDLNTSFDHDSNLHGATLGGAVGLDIGITNLLTITPIVGVRYGTQPYFETIQTDVNGGERNVGWQIRTVQIGLQATFRLDERRY